MSEIGTYESVPTPRDSDTDLLLPGRTIQVRVPDDQELPLRGPVWIYPGMGTATHLDVTPADLAAIRERLSVDSPRLGEWPSTAICSNDLLASVLYSSGLVAEKAGKLAPVAFVLVSAVLYFFRFIYEEVISAIPLNGGSYNVLLNTTSKRVAAFGAALGILSYLATGVVSGSSAIHYLNRQVELPTVVATVALLFVFALLNLVGIAESSSVALVIFLHHVVVLIVLIGACIVRVVAHPDVLVENWRSPLPRVDFAGSEVDSNAFTAVFFGFGVAMLGITGFETSAQFVEEQQPGVFRKTLRNMWWMVSVFNTVLAFLAIGVLPMDTIYANKDTVLAEMGLAAAGPWLESWIAIDSFIVLSGSVLTSYVGITGLVRRLASDRVLPAFLLQQNQCRKTNHSIIMLFFVLMASFVIVMKADSSIMGGVYTYAFLGLMFLFSLGCMVLKAKRPEIPRDVHAPWWSCILGFIFVVIAIFANLLGDPKVLMYFALYFIVVVAVMMVMLDRVQLLKVLLAVMKSLCPSRSSTNSDEAQNDEHIADNDLIPSPVRGDGHGGFGAANTPALLSKRKQLAHTGARGGRTITQAILGIKDTPIVFFCKRPDLTLLNKAILYVRKNEQTSNLRIVHIATDDGDDGESGWSARVRTDFGDMAAMYNYIYPKIKIDFVSIRGAFEPALVEWIAVGMGVPINLTFIAQPRSVTAHRVAMLGVRVITA